MENRYLAYFYKRRKSPLFLLMVVSAILHVSLVVGVYSWSLWMPAPPPPPEMIEVTLAQEASSTVAAKTASVENPALTPPKPPPPPPPPPPKPKEEPKPEPEKPKPEPEKPKPEPEKPKPEPEKPKEEEPKEEEPKPEPKTKGACCLDDGKCLETTLEDCGKRGGLYQGDNVTCKTANCPKPKEEPKKEEPKKEEPKKTEPKKETPKKTEPKEIARDSEEAMLLDDPSTLEALTPTDEPPSKTPGKEQPNPVAPKGPNQSDMVSISDLPPGLMSWGALVKRKVERVWTPPPGIQLAADETSVEISFWVDSQGNLVGRPEVVKAASDPAVAESVINAIMLAQPYPPLPEAYGLTERQVLYEFKLSQ